MTSVPAPTVGVESDPEDYARGPGGPTGRTLVHLSATWSVAGEHGDAARAVARAWQAAMLASPDGPAP